MELDLLVERVVVRAKAQPGTKSSDMGTRKAACVDE
jgi:hypothetical protein